MGRPRGIALPEEVNALRTRIQTWRTHRVGRAQMPRDIWTEAIRLARDFGACRVAKATGLDYKGLRRKIALMQAKENPVPQSFIELHPHPLALPANSQGVAMEWAESIVELSTSDGAQLRVRLGAGSVLNLPELVSAFFTKGQRQLHFPIGGDR